MEKTKILEIIKKENIKFIKLLFADILGNLKSIEICSNEIESALNNKIMIDGSNIVGVTSVNEADTFLSPDINTFKLLPFYNSEYGNVAMFMCDILSLDGTPSIGCSRTILKNKLAEMNSYGFDKMNIGFEPEFYILKSKPSFSLNDIHFIDKGKYDSIENEDVGALVRREIMYELNRIGLTCSTSHHECGFSQSEITYLFSDALSACDNIILVKMLIKAIAIKHGYVATFMPKPASEISGNGLHTNISLSTNNKNMFSGENNNLSSIGLKFIAGILKHAKGLSFITNPTINSYKRLVGGYEAPINICWSVANRSAMIRVPKCGGNSSRIEVRNVDSSSNPYLVATTLLVAGLDGIKNNASIEPINANLYSLDENAKSNFKLTTLPKTLEESINEFNNNELIKSCLNSEVAKLMISIKKEEIFKYNNMVNSFDFDNYF